MYPLLLSPPLAPDVRSAKWERFLFKYDLGWSIDCSQNLWSVAYSTTVTGLIPTYFLCLGFPGGSDGKEFTRSAGDPGSTPKSGRFPGEGNGHPLQYSCLENPTDKKSLAGYSPWGCTASDVTEWLSTQTHVLCLQSAWCYLMRMKTQAHGNYFKRENTVTTD